MGFSDLTEEEKERVLQALAQTPPKYSGTPEKERKFWGGDEKVQESENKNGKWQPSPTAVKVRDGLNSAAGGVIGMVLEVINNLWWFLRKPITYVLVIYGILAFSGWLYSQGENAVWAAWCKQPISRWIGTETCTLRNIPRNGEGSGEPIDVDNLWKMQERLGGVMERAGDGVGMARAMKGTEHAVRDLVALVRHSDFPGREPLSDRLDGFVDGAKRATRDLSRFTAKVAGVVDSVIAMDEFALHTLQALDQPPSLKNRALSIIFPFNTSPNSNESLLKAFSQVTGHMATKIPPLISSAESLLSELDYLEESLSTVKEMVTRDMKNLDSSENEILSSLWNRLLHLRSKDLANFRSHRELLDSVAVYRVNALKLVTDTLVELQQIQADLEEFHVRLGEPAFVGDEVPVQVVIEGIRRGIKRLGMGRFELEGRRRGVWSEKGEIAGGK